MNRTKVNKIVEYIRSQAEFPFDASDVEENVQEVLVWFGIEPVMDRGELTEVRSELVQMGLAAEIAEVARLVEAEFA